MLSYLMRKVMCCYFKTCQSNKLDKNITGPIFPKIVQSILKQKKGSQKIYKILNKNNDEPTRKYKWNRLYDIDEKSWEYIFMAPFKITKCTNLRWYQICINHKIPVTNKFLFQINKIDSPNCSFCSTNEESLEQLFWKYYSTQQFLKEVTEKNQEMSISPKFERTKFYYRQSPPPQTFRIHFNF